MKLTRQADRATSPNEFVTGSAHLERLMDEQLPGGLRLALVHFKDGAVTNWHTHPGEQILLVVAGECRYGNEAGEGGIAHPGDAIHIAPGEKHWHGAVRGQDMAHLSITNVGGPNWMEPYEGA